MLAILKGNLSPRTLKISPNLVTLAVTDSSVQWNILLIRRLSNFELLNNLLGNTHLVYHRQHSEKILHNLWRHQFEQKISFMVFHPTQDRIYSKLSGSSEQAGQSGQTVTISSNDALNDDPVIIFHQNINNVNDEEK